MAQKQEETSKKKEKDKLGELKKKLNDITKEKKKERRKVTLWYTSCCGCGCDDLEIIREVDNDSPLQDGDIATDFLDGDEWANE